MLSNLDLAYLTLLFKPCINQKYQLILRINHMDINHKNILNTALHVHHDQK